MARDRLFLVFTLLLIVASVSGCTEQATPAVRQNAHCTEPSVFEGEYSTIPAGQFVMGVQAMYHDEGPELTVHVDNFEMQTHEVTNAQFTDFVAETNYVTDAERSVVEQSVGAGSAVFIPSNDRAPAASPWALVEGASWRTPEGPGSDIAARLHHPVVHVSQRDAATYAEWAGGRLPSEVEWEYAATLGLPDISNPTSGAYDANGPRANTWQGIFPISDTGTDGYHGTSPVGCFPKDKAGLFDMIGNVWEWTDTPYGEGTHTMKGGSYLCADNFCRRYRPAARHPQDTDFSSSHIGFRIVRDIGDTSK